MKKSLCIVLSVVLFFSMSLLLMNKQHAKAAYIKLEYELPDPIGDSIRINSKEQYSIVEGWVKNKPSNHTGWSAVLFEYNAEATTIYDNKETHWWPIPGGSYNTRDGFEGVTYPVSMFKDKIIAEHGQEMYDRLVASGLRFDVKSGQSVDDYQDYSFDSRTKFSNPKTGDKGFLYYENDITVYLEHYYDGTTPTDPTDPTEPGVEEPEPEPDDNIPPVAIIDTLYPSYKMGDRVIYYGSNSYDPDAEPDANGKIKNNGIQGYTWKVDETAVTEDGKRGEEDRNYSLYYMKEGFYDMGLRVRDSDGATDETTHTVQITPPTIEAKILASGTLKENRHVKLESEIDTPEKFPLIPEKTVWTIKPLDGQENSVCVRDIEGCQETQTVTGIQELDVLFKKDETYEISLHVENTAGYTYDTKEVYTPDGYRFPYLYIAEDELPISNFAAVQTVYRDIDNNNKATIKLTDKSVSNDDIIAKRIWSIKYDSDNNGYYTNEESIIISDTNETNLEYEVDNVGNYQVTLEVVEEFGQPTLEEFVTPEDRKRNISSKIVKVDNLSPTVSYEVRKRETADVSVIVGDTIHGDISAIETKLNEILKVRLNEESIDLNVKLQHELLKAGAEDRQLVGYANHEDGSRAFEVYFFHDDQYVYAEGYFYQDPANRHAPEIISFKGMTPNGRNTEEFGNDGLSMGITKQYGYGEPHIVPIAKITNRNMTITWDSNYADWTGGQNIVFTNYEGNGRSHIWHGTQSAYSFTAYDYTGPNYKYNYEPIEMYQLIARSPFDEIDYNSSSSTVNLRDDVDNTLDIIGLFRIGTGEKLPTYLPKDPNEIIKVTWKPGGSGLYLSDTANGNIYSNTSAFKVRQTTYSNRPSAINKEFTIFGTGNNVRGNYDLTSSFKESVRAQENRGWTLKPEINRVGSSRGTISKRSYYDDKEFEIIYIDPNSPNTFTEIKKSKSTSKQFLTVLEDSKLSKWGENYISNSLANAESNGDIPLISLGTTLNQSQFNQLITKNNSLGTFIDNSDIEQAINKMADYIIEQFKKDRKENELYITLDEAVEYITKYSDAENDPKLAEKWKYDHNPNVFENNQGQIENNMVYQEKPINQFTKVGRYQVFYTAQDDPLERFAEMGLDPTKFEEYRKWAKDADNMYIYVHRKPVALFEAYMVKGSGKISISDKSYDLDKESLPERGIEKKEWSYRKVGDTNWTSGKPATLSTAYAWEIRLIVTDYQGATDQYIAQVSAVDKLPNVPPIAEIQVKPIHYIGDTILVTNKSSDPDGNPLTYSYQVTRPNGTKVTINKGDSRMDANGNLTIVADTHPTDLGNWTFTLTVSDGTETASDTRSTTVVDQIIQGQVAHTDKWLENIQRYNMKHPSKAFNLDPAIDLLEFLPGERFVLNSSENTSNRLVSVVSYIKESSRGIDYKSLYGTVLLNRMSEQNFTNSLWHETMLERFRDGEILTFEFIGTFANGWVDIETVQVRIKDDPYWRQHTTY